VPVAVVEPLAGVVGVCVAGFVVPLAAVCLDVAAGAEADGFAATPVAGFGVGVTAGILGAVGVVVTGEGGAGVVVAGVVGVVVPVAPVDAASGGLAAGVPALAPVAWLGPGARTM
jgi:hypothetical protein